jgi:hypothetical protein
MVERDLGLKKRDKGAVRQRLLDQGIEADDVDVMGGVDDKKAGEVRSSNTST